MCVYACTYVSMLLHGYTYTHAHICLYMSIPGVYNRALLCSQSCCVESALSGLYANETSDLWSNLRQGTYGGEQKNNYYKSILLIGNCDVRSGRTMYGWPVSSLRIPVPAVCSGFPGTDVSLGLTDVSLGLMCAGCASCLNAALFAVRRS